LAGRDRHVAWATNERVATAVAQAFFGSHHRVMRVAHHRAMTRQGFARRD
jgi:hypothetical protein